MAFARKSDQEDAKNHKSEKQGMEMNRSCTDIICCFLFIVFVIVMIGVSGYAITQGDPMKIFTPFDSDGNQCGMPNQKNTTGLGERDFTDYPFRQYTGLDMIIQPDTSGLTGETGPNKYDAVCVKKCMEFADVPVTGLELVNMATTTQPENIKLSLNPLTTSSDVIAANLVLIITLNSTNESGTCMPAGMTDPEYQEKIKEELTAQFKAGFGSYISDIKESWQVLLIMAFVVIIITLFYIYLLRCITKPILYGSLLGIFVFLLLCTYYTYDNTLQFTDKDSNDYKFAMFLFIVCAILTVAYMVLVCCMWRAIALGAAVMETASDFIGDNKKVVFLPFIAYFFCLPIVAWWTTTSVFIYGLGTPEGKIDSFVCNIAASQQSEYMFWYCLFGMFWLVAFIIAIQLFTTACTVCLWYFGEKEGGSDQGYVWLSLKWAFRFHLGSLAWGAFLIAVITTIRVVFEYIVYQYEKTAMKDNIVFKIVTCIIRCCLKCLDCCIKFMNKNAYIQVALHNDNFCTAAKNSFWLIANNGRRFTAVGITGSILMFLGKALITTACTFICLAIVDAMFKDIEQPFIPALVVALFAYMISSVFLAVFDFSALTILHCFCLDEQNGGGSRNTPDGLKKFLEQTEAVDKMKEDVKIEAEKAD